MFISTEEESTEGRGLRPLTVHGVLTRVTPSDPPRSQGHTATVTNEKVLFLGGILSPENIHSRFPGPYGKYNPFVYCYDNYFLEWIIVDAKFLYPREGHTCVRYKSECIIHGGYGPQGLSLETLAGKPGEGHMNDTLSLDLRTVQCHVVETGGIPAEYRAGHAAVVHGHYMYVFGGCGVDVLEKTNSEEEGSASSKVPVVDSSARFFLREKILGHFVKLHVPTRVWSVVETPEVSGHEERKSMPIEPSPRWGHRMTLHGEVVCLFGGRDQETIYNSLDIFDFKRQTWQRVEAAGTEPPARYLHQQLCWEEFLFVSGGIGKEDSAVREETCLWVLDMGSFIWQQLLTSGLSRGVSSATMAALCDRAKQRKIVQKCHRYVDAANYAAKINIEPSEGKHPDIRKKASKSRSRQLPTCDTHLMFFGGAIGFNPSRKSSVSAVYEPLEPHTCMGTTMVLLRRLSAEDVTYFRGLSPANSTTSRNVAKAPPSPSPERACCAAISMNQSTIPWSSPGTSPKKSPKKVTKRDVNCLVERLQRRVKRPVLEETMIKHEPVRKLTKEEQEKVNRRHCESGVHRKKALQKSKALPKKYAWSDLELRDFIHRLHTQPLKASAKEREKLTSKYVPDRKGLQYSPTEISQFVGNAYTKGLKTHEEVLLEVRKKYIVEHHSKVITEEAAKTLFERLSKNKSK